jgi:hypothetical protein
LGAAKAIPAARATKSTATDATISVFFPLTLVTVEPPEVAEHTQQDAPLSWYVNSVPTQPEVRMREA